MPRKIVFLVLTALSQLAWSQTELEFSLKGSKIYPTQEKYNTYDLDYYQSSDRNWSPFYDFNEKERLAQGMQDWAFSGTVIFPESLTPGIKNWRMLGELGLSLKKRHSHYTYSLNDQYTNGHMYHINHESRFQMLHMNVLWGMRHTGFKRWNVSFLLGWVFTIHRWRDESIFMSFSGSEEERGTYNFQLGDHSFNRSGTYLFEEVIPHGNVQIQYLLNPLRFGQFKVLGSIGYYYLSPVLDWEERSVFMKQPSFSYSIGISYQPNLKFYED